MVHNHDHAGVRGGQGLAKYAEGGGETRFAPSLVAPLGKSILIRNLTIM